MVESEDKGGGLEAGGSRSTVFFDVESAKEAEEQTLRRETVRVVMMNRGERMEFLLKLFMVS